MLGFEWEAQNGFKKKPLFKLILWGKWVHLYYNVIIIVERNDYIVIIDSTTQVNEVHGGL